MLSVFVLFSFHFGGAQDLRHASLNFTPELYLQTLHFLASFNKIKQSPKCILCYLHEPIQLEYISKQVILYYWKNI